jgi:hypothetical protein
VGTFSLFLFVFGFFSRVSQIIEGSSLSLLPFLCTLLFFFFLVSRFSLCSKQGSAGYCRLGGIRKRLNVICRSWGLVKLHVLDFHFWVINSDDFADGFRLWR